DLAGDLKAGAAGIVAPAGFVFAFDRMGFRALGVLARAARDGDAGERSLRRNGLAAKVAEVHGFTAIASFRGG
ncbi:MAG TPA: hypothetical protein VGE07_13790, partial [Herpetosiphonaceae bacterium]